MIVIPTNEVLIVALDVATVDEAKKLVNDLGDTVHFYKVGLQLFSSRDSYAFIEWLHSINKKVFLDLKMFDIPETVFRATLQHDELGVTYTTVHGCSIESVSAAVSASSTVGVLAVTVLTSQPDGVDTLLVGHRAKNACDVGARGAVMSGWEVEHTRKQCDDFVVVCPGIRDTDMARHDQNRTIEVEAALENGAHHLVVGRPITQNINPAEKADSIQFRISNLLNCGYENSYKDMI